MNDFAKINGILLRTVNILRYKYNSIESILNYLEQSFLDKSELVNAIAFLADNEYLHIRDVATKKIIPVTNDNYCYLEVKVTAKGIRILAGALDDDLIEV